MFADIFNFGDKIKTLSYNTQLVLFWSWIEFDRDRISKCRKCDKILKNLQSNLASGPCSN